VNIIKVVVFFTTKLTKLVLHFSDFSTILYGFYKFLQKSNTIPEHSFKQAPRSFKMLTQIPSVCDVVLRKIWEHAMQSQGAGRRRSGQIPANRRPGPAGLGRGRDLGS
jgi:hypothetical protein